MDAAGAPASSASVAISRDDRTLVVVNLDANSVSVFDVTQAQPKKLAELSTGLGQAMRGIERAALPESQLMATRGW